MDWCNDVLNAIVAKAFNNYDKYMKGDLKRQAIIQDNSFAVEVEKLREALQARVTLLSDKIDDVRNMSRLLEQMARKKGFK